MAKNSFNIMFVMVKNNLNIILVVILVLLLIILANVYYSCKNSIKENFEDVTMKPAKKNSVLTDEEIKKIVDTVTNENDTQNIIEKVKAHVNNKNDKNDSEKSEESKDIDNTEKKEDKEEIVLSKKETELFNAIKKDNISNDELDRLVKSGVVNEDMIMRFLQKMEDGNDEDVVEEFTSCGMYEGFSSCARDYATF